MATIYISEFANAGNAESGFGLQAAKLPAVAVHSVTVAGASAQSPAVLKATKFLRVACDVACHIKYSANPVATMSDIYMPANSVEYFGVDGGGKLAVIAGA